MIWEDVTKDKMHWISLLLDHSTPRTGRYFNLYKTLPLKVIRCTHFYNLPNFSKLTGAEFLIAVVMNSSILWDIMPCDQLYIHRCFAGRCHLHLQGRRKSQARCQREVVNKCQKKKKNMVLMYLVLYTPMLSTELPPKNSQNNIHATTTKAKWCAENMAKGKILLE
jgi:hypothetical protein